MRLTSLCQLLLTIFFAGVCLSMYGSEVAEWKSDSLKIESILDSAYSLEAAVPQEAIRLYRQAAARAVSLNMRKAEGRALQYIGYVYHALGQFDSAREYYKRALLIFQELPYRAGEGATYVNIGNIFKYKAAYGKAIDYYLKGIRIFEDIGDTSRLIYAYTNIGTVLSDVGQYDRSRDYNLISLSLSTQTGDSLSMADAYSNLAYLDYVSGRSEAAAKGYKKALAMAQQTGDRYMLYLSNYSLATLDFEGGRYATALAYSKKSLSYAEKLKTPQYIASARAQTGHVFYLTGELDSAAHYLGQAIALADANDLQETLLNAYLWMSDLEEKRGRYRKALGWRQKYESLSQKLQTEKQKRIAAGLEIAFESEKKDLLIKEKNMEIERKGLILAGRNSLIIALSVAFCSLLIFFFLVRRSLKQKRIIAEKDAAIQSDRLQKLKKEQQLLAMKSIMEGQEKERMRLARDLHDGLGGMLASIRNYISALGSRHPELNESEEYQKVVTLVDNTSAEARRISQNLMPGALMRFGLSEAIKDLCESLSGKDGLIIDFQSYGKEPALAENQAVFLFRIAQELINNIVRHAEASEAIVQLLFRDKKVYLTVEDNGKGYDPADTGKQGMGLSNIRSRVEYLSGLLEISSVINEGSTTSIEFPIE